MSIFGNEEISTVGAGVRCGPVVGVNPALSSHRLQPRNDHARTRYNIRSVPSGAKTEI